MFLKGIGKKNNNRKKPNKNKNHTKDRMKAEYGWMVGSIVFSVKEEEIATNFTSPNRPKNQPTLNTLIKGI